MYRNTVPSSASRPVTPEERIEWKRLALEEAVARMAADPHRGRIFVEAAIARHAELQQLRDLHKKPARDPRGAHERPWP